jgi:hypothetical protein
LPGSADGKEVMYRLAGLLAGQWKRGRKETPQGRLEWFILRPGGRTNGWIDLGGYFVGD